MKKFFAILGLGAFFALIGLGIFGERGIIQLKKLRAERKKLEQKIKILEQENDELAQKIKLLQNDFKYLERLARQKLGMIRPDELILKLPEDELENQNGKDESE